MSQEEEEEEAEIIPSRTARGRDHFQSGWRTECTTHSGGLRLSLVKGTLTHTRQYVHHSCWYLSVIHTSLITIDEHIFVPPPTFRTGVISSIPKPHNQRLITGKSCWCDLLPLKNLVWYKLSYGGTGVSKEPIDDQSVYRDQKKRCTGAPPLLTPSLVLFPEHTT